MLQGAGPLAQPPFSVPLDACSLDQQQQQQQQQLGCTPQQHQPLQQECNKRSEEETLWEGRGSCGKSFPYYANNSNSSNSSNSTISVRRTAGKSQSREYGQGEIALVDKCREQQPATQPAQTHLLQQELQQELQRELQQDLQGELKQKAEQREDDAFSTFVPWPGRTSSYRRPAATAPAVTGAATASTPAAATGECTGTWKREFELLQQGLAAAAVVSSSSSGRSRNESSVGRAVRRQASRLKRLTANFLTRSLSSTSAGSAMARGSPHGRPPPLDSRVFVGEDALLAELPLEVEESLLDPFLSWSCTQNSIDRRRSGELGLLTLLNHSTPLKLAVPLDTDSSGPAGSAPDAAAAATMPQASAAAAAAPGPCPYILPFEDIVKQLGPLIPRPSSIDAPEARRSLGETEVEASTGDAGTVARVDAATATAAASGLATPSSAHVSASAPESSADQGNAAVKLDTEAAAGEADGGTLAAARTPLDVDDAAGARGSTGTGEASAATAEETNAAEASLHAEGAEEAGLAKVAVAALAPAHALGADFDTKIATYAASETAGAMEAAELAAEVPELTAAKAADVETAAEPTRAGIDAATEPALLAKGTGEATEYEENFAAESTGAGYLLSAAEVADAAAAPEAVDAAAAEAAQARWEGWEEPRSAAKAPEAAYEGTSEAAKAEEAEAAAEAAVEIAAEGRFLAAIRGEETPSALGGMRTEYWERNFPAAAAAASVGAAADATEAEAATGTCSPMGDESGVDELYGSRLTTSSQPLTSRGGEEDADTLEARQLRLGLSAFPEWLMQVDADADEQRPNPYKAVRLRKTGLLPGREDGKSDEATARRIRARLDWMKSCAAKGKQQSRQANTSDRGAAVAADAAAATPDALSQSKSSSVSTAPDAVWRRREAQQQQGRRAQGPPRSGLCSSDPQHPAEADDLGPEGLTASEAKGHSVAALRALFERSRAAWFEGELQRFSQISDTGDPTKASGGR